MGPLSSLRAANAKADRWFRNHVVVWWLLLAVVPGGAYASFSVLIGEEPFVRAIVLGTVFGLTFATMTVLVQRGRRS